MPITTPMMHPAVAVASAALVPAVALAQPTLHEAGPAGDVWDAVVKVTDPLSDGQGVLVLAGRYAAAGPGAFVWRPGTGAASLANGGGVSFTSACGMSEDGRVAVGMLNSSGGQRSMCAWSVPAGAPTLIQNVPAPCTDLSGDGTKLVGASTIWSVDGSAATHVPVPAGYTSMQLLRVSRSGSVGTGRASRTGEQRAFRWSAADGSQVLPLPPGAQSARSFSISPDGLVIAGIASYASTERPCTWVRGEVTDLGGLFAAQAPVPEGVSRGGALIGGFHFYGGLFEQQAWIWQRDGVVERLPAFLSRHGIDTAGWQFAGVMGVSPDGTAIAGTALHDGRMVVFVVTGLPRVACGPADIGGPGADLPDGRLDNSDFITFIDWFFYNLPEADIAGAAAAPGADGVLDNNDFIAFINQFFAGC